MSSACMVVPRAHMCGHHTVPSSVAGRLSRVNTEGSQQEHECDNGCVVTEIGNPSSRVQHTKIYFGPDRRRHRRPGGSAAGDGLCHCIGRITPGGIYCAIVTGFLISALGGSKTQIGG